MTKLLPIFFLILSLTGFSQYENHTWYGGNSAVGLGFDRNTNAPFPITGQTPLGGTEGSLIVNEPTTGSLIFYTDGITIYNKANVVMQNGAGLSGSNQGGQPAGACLIPGETDQYYLFTNSANIPNVSAGSIYQNRIDVLANGGDGQLLLAGKNTLITSGTAEGMIVIAHQNQKDYWLITQLFNTNTIQIFSINDTGTNLFSSVNIGPVGQARSITFNERSKQLSISYFIGTDMAVFDFDHCTGLLSNYQSISSGTSTLSSEWSLDNTKLYYCVYSPASIWQYDFNTSTNTQISTTSGGLKMGPDNKIYVTHFGNYRYVSVIDQPNNAGVACDFYLDSIDLGSALNAFDWPATLTTNKIFEIKTLETCFEDQTKVYLNDTIGVTSVNWKVFESGNPIPVFDNNNIENTFQFSSSGTYAVFADIQMECFRDTIYDTFDILEISPLNLGNDTTLCFGENITLSAGLIDYDYILWSDSSENNTLNVDSISTIWVEKYKAQGNLIYNADFELGNIGFYSQYLYPIGGFAPDNRYQVSTSIGGCGSDHTSGSGQFYAAGGNTGTNENAWCQNVDLISGTKYVLSYFGASFNSPNPAQNQFSIDGNLIASPKQLSSATCAWEEFYEIWESNVTGNVEFCIINQTPTTGGNDFMIDDIVLAPLCAKRDSIDITVLDSISNPILSIKKTCFEDQTIISLLDSMDVDSVLVEIQHESSPGTISYTSTQIIDTIQFAQSGFHYISVIAYLGCKIDTLTDTFSISQVDPVDLGNDTALCFGDSLLLDAGADYDFYLWNDGDTSRFKVANSSGQYSVKVSKIADNLLYNGDFELGNIGFTSGHTFQNQVGTVINAGFYDVIQGGTGVYSNIADCIDHTTGSSNLFTMNGSTSVSGIAVWCSSVQVEPNTDYVFSTWLTRTSSSNPAILNFQINSALIGSPFQASTVDCDWSNFYEIWNSGANTSADICLFNTQTQASGNSISLDDVYFANLCSKFDTINITIQTDSIKLNCLASDLKCNNDNSGSIEINPTGSSGTGYQYQIDADAFQDTSNTYADLAANTYTVTVTDDAGCTNDTSITLSEPLALSLNTVSTKDTRCFDLCDGEILLSSSGGTSPFTFSLDGSTSTSGTDSLFNALCDGSYLASVIDSNLCIDSFSIIINEPTELSISSSVIDTCVDNAVNVSINVSGGTPTYDYLWNGASLSSSENIIVSSDSIISVYVIDDSLCHSDTIDITINKSPTLDFIVDSISCNGLSDGSILVTPTGGGSTYQYSVDASPFASSNSIGSLSAGNHTLSVTDERNCVVDTTFQVFEPLPLVASIANQLNALCKDSCDGEVELTSTGGISPISFTLDGNTPDIAPATFNGLCDGTYSAVATDNNGCQNTISVVITEPNALTVSFPSDTCLLLPTGLFVTGNGGTVSSDYTYIWNQNNNITGNGINAWSNQLDTVYSVFIIDDNLCVSPSIDINVHIVPTIDYILTNDTTVTYGDQLELVALGGYQYSWSPSDVLDNPTDNKPIASPSETTTFQLDIVVGQCITTDTVLVNVIQGDLFIPNIFSPDGDGFNDIFRIRGAIFDEFQMNIFNRWGEKVFDSKDQFEGWDGTFRNQDAQEGVYGFIILGTTNQGNEVKEKGNITLMR